ncbi:hypothetical protein CLU81_0568 [Flavobacterium sp. 9]|uniref:hypothetical protein n=1 Tax=Flavobacterium sp. 9 TaxID=2035198 RepID=UPI000C45FA1C|nr:hypothetical protein [Flavobacterium sp. 9]PIF30161.1 hypothetical protein CLU81_0568 [Flavobacterium sp. 9]
MKKIFLVFVIFIYSICNAQNDSKKSPLKIDLITDNKGGWIAYKLNKNLRFLNKEHTTGFSIVPHLNIKKKLDYFQIATYNIGNCDEKGTVIFSFEDNTTLTLKSFSTYNCDGSAAFFYDSENVKILSAKKIKKIRYKNGRSGESYTTSLKPEEENYFITLFNFLNNKQ